MDDWVEAMVRELVAKEAAEDSEAGDRSAWWWADLVFAALDAAHEGKDAVFAAVGRVVGGVDRDEEG